MENTINEECHELKNIKYKTMLLNRTPKKETKLTTNDISFLEKFLETEQQINVNGPWCKLDNTIKMKKLACYVKTYKETNNLNDEEESHLITFLRIVWREKL